MVQVIQPRDIYGEIGQAFGQGAGDFIGQQVDRNRMLQALDTLKDLENPITYQEGGKTLTRQPSYAEKLTSLVKAGAGIPGWMGVVETLAPTLLKESTGKAGSRAFSGDQQKPNEVQNSVVPALTNERETKTEVGQGTKEITVPEGYKREIAPQDIDSKIADYLKKEQEYADTSFNIPEEYMSELPRYKDQVPSYNVPTEQEVRQIIEDTVSSGGTYQDALNLIDKKGDLNKQRYQSQLESFKRNLGIQEGSRRLEESQRDFVDRKSKGFLVEKGYGTPTEDGKDYNVPQFYTDAAYNMYRKYASKNPKWTDQQNWSAARKDLDQLLELEASVNDLTRPLLPLFKGTENAIKQTQSWVDDYLNLAGNTPEARDKAKTFLMNNGWSRNRATEFVQPMSQGLKSIFKKLPKIPTKALTQVREGAAQHLIKKRNDAIEQIQNYVPEIAKEFGDASSILLFRNNLINEKNLTQTQADEIIEQIRKYRGGFMPEQSKEIPLLQKSPIRDMWDIFHNSLWGE